LSSQPIENKSLPRLPIPPTSRKIPRVFEPKGTLSNLYAKPVMRYDIPPPGFIARNYTQRPKSHFSPQARQLLFNFAASTQCELGELMQSGPLGSNNTFSRASSSPAEPGSVGLRDNLRMAATLAEGTARKLVIRKCGRTMTNSEDRGDSRESTGATLSAGQATACCQVAPAAED
jgi:hypothetical protein